MPIWEELTMEEFESLMVKNPLFVLPVGSLEGHGAHLPLGTDYFQPKWLVEELDKVLPVILAPPLLYANCVSTEGFPGSLSVDPEILRKFVKEILKGFIKNGAKSILIISGHAAQSHLCALRDAARDIVRSHPRVDLWCLSDYELLYNSSEEFKEVPKDDGHGGMMETSRVLAIRPELVKMDKIKGKEKESSYPSGYRIAEKPWESFPYGYVGYPQKASKSLGEKLNRYLLKQLLSLVKTSPDNR